MAFDWSKATEEERAAEHRREEAAELAKVPAAMMELIREQRDQRVADLRAQALRFERMSDREVVEYVGVRLGSDDLVASAKARACWPALDAALSRGEGEPLTISYCPSKQVWAWDAYRAHCSWYVSTDEIAEAFRKHPPRG